MATQLRSSPLGPPTAKRGCRAQVEQLLLSEPNNQEYEDLYNSITEVREQLCMRECPA